MGMYTGIRFKGTVKEEFRKGFGIIAIEGDWELHLDDNLKAFGDNVGRSGFIPCGCLSYMPDKWEKDYINPEGNKEPEFSSDKDKPIEEVKYYKQVDTDGFKRTYNEETGYWTFQCSLKNYESEIEIFFKLLPYFIESIDHLEYFYEEDTWSQKYELVNGKVVETSDKFVLYGYEDENSKWGY